MFKKRAPHQGTVKLTTCTQIHTGERSINREIEGGHKYLRQVNVHFFCSVRPSYCSLIDYREIQMCSEKAVYTAFRCPGIHQSVELCHSRYGRMPGRAESVIWVKPDIDE